MRKRRSLRKRFCLERSKEEEDFHRKEEKSGERRGKKREKCTCTLNKIRKKTWFIIGNNSRVC